MLFFAARIQEADEFYSLLQREIDNGDERLVQRQATGGNDLEQTVLFL